MCINLVISYVPICIELKAISTFVSIATVDEKLRLKCV